MAVECVIKNAAKSVGEGPHWDDVTKTLLYVDIQENAIHRYCPESKEDSTIQLDDTVGFVVPARKGGLIAGVGRCLVHVDWDSKKVTKLHEVDHGLKTRFNDGKCDPQGRVWAGTMGPVDPDVENMPKIGSLYRLDLDGSLHTMVKDVGISNGLAWTADEKSMFYIDTTPRQIYRYDFDKPTGKISNKKVVVNNAGKPLNDYGFPDGMTIDTEDKLWVACFFASKVIRYDPETGQQLQCINIPSALRITSCCFGGLNLDELYVTCSAHEVLPEEFEKYPLSGSVFRVTNLGVKGRKAHVYEGEIKALNRFNMAVECVIKNAAKSAAEGPHWDDVTNTLLFVDAVEKSIHRYQPGTETDESFHTEDIVTFMVPAKRGGFIAAVGCCLVHLDWDTKKVTKLQESDQKLQFNDGKCDPQGRVWAGTVGPMASDLENMPRIGSLYRLDLDGSLHAMVRDIGISNGLAWSSDEKFMFYIDSIPRKVYRYDFDTSTGNISNQRVVVDMEGKSVEDYGFPDGMTIDAEDKLWIACFFAGKVARYDPETGQRLQCIDIPSVLRVTSCCFGGKGLDELYVTTSAYGSDKAISSEEFEKYPLSGSLFRVTGLGVKGRKARIYEGNIDHLKI